MVTAGNQAQRYDKKMTYARDETKKNADETDRRKKMPVLTATGSQRTKGAGMRGWRAGNKIALIIDGGRYIGQQLKTIINNYKKTIINNY